MRKFFILLALLLVTLLLGIVGLLGYATGTDHGLQRVLKLGQDVAPGDLQWEQASGRLLGPLDIKNLHYRQDDGLEVKLGSLALQWQPGKLLSRQLKIDRLHATDLELHLPAPSEAPKPDAPLTLPEIHLPLSIQLQDLDLSNIRVFPYGATDPIIVDSLKLAAASSEDTLQVLDFQLRSAEAQATLSGTVNPTGDYPLDLKLAWGYQHPQFGPFNGSGTISGDLKALQLSQNIEGAAQVTLDADLLTVLTDPGWDARLKLSSQNLGVFAPALEAAPLKATLLSKGHLKDFQATAVIETELSQTGPVRLNLDAQGDSRKIQLSEAVLKRVNQPGELRLSGDVDLETLAADINADWKALGWPLVGDTAEFTSPAGKLHFKGTAQDYIAKVTARLEGQQLVPLQAQLNANGSDQAIELSKLTLYAIDGDLKLIAQGAFNIAEQRFDAQGNWQAAAWPLTGTAQVESPSGQFKASGLINDYQFQLTTKVSGTNIPAGHWQLKGQGSDQALSDFTVDGKLLEGSLTAKGKAAWQPEVNWQVSVNGSDINPGVQWPDLPGKLSLALKSQGKLTPDGPDLSADISNLSGQFRGQPLRGQGQVALKGTSVDVRQFRISSGKARIEANGSLGERWNLDWTLDTPDLAQLVPDFGGSIRANGTLSGSASQPQARFKLDVNNLVAGESKIKSLKGGGNIDLASGKRSRLDLTGSGLQLAGQAWKDLKLTGAGTAEKHHLEIKLNGDLARLDLGLAGGLFDQQWHGKLTRLAARKTDFGDWVLKQPAGLTAGKTQATAEPICLSSQPSLLCLSGNWDAQQGAKGEMTLEKLEPKRFQKFLPVGLTLTTLLDGKAQGSMNSAGIINADAKFNLSPGLLEMETDAEPLRVKLGASTLKARVQGDKASTRIALDLGRLGRVDANTIIRNFKSDGGLSGTLQARLGNLAVISAFVPQLQDVKGDLSADLKLGGNLKTPTVSGDLKLADFNAEVPQMAIQIENTQLTAHSTGTGPLRIQGSAQSGGGKLTLSGELDPASRALKLEIKGDNFQVANSKSIKARLSPDLRIAMNSEGMRVDGELLIPSAYIDADGGGGEHSTIGVSSDVIVIEKDGEVPPKSKASAMHLNLRIILGDDIKVEAKDFSGALKGNLVVTQTPELAPRGTGTIEVVNGDYVVYGQQLKIERGRILFSGGPVDNPRLDMDVARRIEAYDVTAGARIRGTAQAPLLQLYSEPSMPDAAILSYMLLGQPPGTKGGSYTLGKYLTPDLYVSYGIGLFNAINTFNMRYRLTDKFSLQAASGAASSADLIYTIER